jgi:hypothetical protein
VDAGRSEAEIPRTREYWILDGKVLFPLRKGGKGVVIDHGLDGFARIYVFI